MLGSYLGKHARRFNVRLFHKLFGTADFHSHLRLRWLNHYSNLGAAKVCELGCGVGINLIELALRGSQITAVGFEGKDETVRNGQAKLRDMHLENRVTLVTCDLTTTFPQEISSADYILLIDVLEHLPEPMAAAKKIKEAAKPGASILVSVPTPMYPKIFGKRFHQDIGHLHDGFVLQQTNQMFAGLEYVWHRYSTGPLSWPGALLYYRLPPISTHNTFGRRASRLINTVKAWGALPFRFIDFWNTDSVSCSLFVEYKKPANA